MGTMTKKIEILLIELGLEKKELAKRLNISPANLSGKLKRDNFSEKELQEIAKACGVEYKGIFAFDNGKEI